MRKFVKDKWRDLTGQTELTRRLNNQSAQIASLQKENARLSRNFSDKFEASFDMHLRGNSRMILLTSVRGGRAFTVDFNVSKGGYTEIRELLLSIFGREWPEIHIVDAPRFVQDGINEMYRRESRGQF